jgi:hypothetical protein
MITVFVGEEKETFAVHRDLLKLHSGLVREHFEWRAAGDSDDGKLALPNFKPGLFAEFVAWMYMGDFLQDMDQPLGEEDPCTQLWTMGAHLKAQCSSSSKNRGLTS